MSDQQKRKDSKRESKVPDEYIFEQFRVPRGCLGYLIADPRTKLAAVVDPEAEMVEPMLDSIFFKHGLRPAYIIDPHTDHISGAPELKSKTVAKLVMHEKTPLSFADVRMQDGGTGRSWGT